MITAQDIRERTFEKARIGGYDMAEVDDFLEELAEDITATQKENAVLKSKMKVLVDKIEEYRSNEEALNMGVLSAQKLAVQIEADARTRSAAMLSDADAQVKAKLGTIPEQIAEQESKLAAAQSATASYLKKMREFCNKQLKAYSDIDDGIAPAEEAPVPEEEPVDVDETVRTIEKTISRIKPEPEFKFDLSDAIDDEPAPRSRKRGFDSTQPFSL